MDKYTDIKAIFEAHRDDEQARAMSKYMRDQFSFYGIPAPKRKELFRPFLQAEKKAGKIDWAFLDRCYADPHREFQYLVCDCLVAMHARVSYPDLAKIKAYVTDRPWWDTIDALCRVVGDVALRDERVGKLMRAWAVDDNFWVRRVAIEHQLGLKEKTDTTLLSDILTANFGSDEFFINKAIGWSLRDYGKYDPRWVSRFIDRHKDKMSRLSVREGSKYLPAAQTASEPHTADPTTSAPLPQ